MYERVRTLWSMGYGKVKKMEEGLQETLETNGHL